MDIASSGANKVAISSEFFAKNLQKFAIGSDCLADKPIIRQFGLIQLTYLMRPVGEGP